MHDAQSRIAVGNAVHEHACGANIHELLEGQVFLLHLAPYAEDVFGPPVDTRLDRGALQLVLQLRLELLDVALSLGAANLERGGNVLVLGGFEIAECQILQFPLDLPNPQTIGQGRINLARLHRELALQRRPDAFG